MTDIIKYTSLFSCAGIGETFNADVGLEATVSNELLGNRARYYQAKYKTSTMIPGDIMDDDIVCTIGQEDKKLLLFDNFKCWDEGCLMGKVSPEVISQMRKSNS